MSKVVISLDLDAFYCGVEERYDPTLIGVPFIVYQKNCIATLSYAAREMGIKKLGSVSEAVKKHPDIRLVNGESLAKYRAEGKKILDFVSKVFEGCVPIERLGLEELRIDLTKVVDYNMAYLRRVGLLDYIEGGNEEIDDDLPEGVSLFMSDRSVDDGAADPDCFDCDGFFFSVPAKVLPDDKDSSLLSFNTSEDLLRLYVGAQLAFYLIDRLSLELGYSCSIGVGPNKTIAKMVCGLNKPRGLTVIFPEYVQDYLDTLKISKIPGFGHKTVKRIEEDMKKVVGGSIFTGKPNELANEPSELEVNSYLTVHEVRTKKTKTDFVRLFGQKQGSYLWDLLHGIDNSPVKEASDIPSQISIEDTYKRLDSIAEVSEALIILLKSLLRQICSDLIDSENQTWKIFPSTFRLTISRSGNNPYAMRQSKSCRLSTYLYDEIFSFSTPSSFDSLLDTLSSKLLHDIVLDLFKQLSNARVGEKLNVRLLNVAVTNFVEDRPSPFSRSIKTSRSLSKQSRGIMDRFLKKA